MKTIYFMRHGESEENAGDTWKDNSICLTKKGRDQAKTVTKQLAKLTLDIVICSTLKRAVETAQIISKKLSKDIDTTNLLDERKPPSQLLGKLKSGPISNKINRTIINNFHISSFRYSDEENFEDLKKRVKSVLVYLSNRKEKNILVVTHGFFMRILLAYIIHGNRLTGSESVDFIKNYYVTHCGINTVTHDEEQKNSWKICIK